MQGLVRDRELWLEPGESVQTDWIPIDLCVRGSDHRLSVGDVGEKWRELLQQGGRQAWPGLIGEWQGERFVVRDGNHTLAALMMHGVKLVLVCWRVRLNEGRGGRG